MRLYLQFTETLPKIWKLRLPSSESVSKISSNNSSNVHQSILWDDEPEANAIVGGGQTSVGPSLGKETVVGARAAPPGPGTAAGKSRPSWLARGTCHEKRPPIRAREP